MHVPNYTGFNPLSPDPTDLKCIWFARKKLNEFNKSQVLGGQCYFTEYFEVILLLN